jgi:O-antigen ligase
MSPVAAKLICAVWVAALFYLNRDRSFRTSIALWIPVLWFAITGSRPLSAWFGVGDIYGVSVAELDSGSPFDANFYATLTAIGVGILAWRWRSTRLTLATNWPLLLYFGYCLLSVAWSDTPNIALKRWVKSTGDIVMALLVVTDAQPLGALRRLFSRLGFLLLPFSLIAMRYIPEIGRYFDFWDGSPHNSGVTTNKNALGADAFILGLGALWQVLRLLPRSNIPNRSRQLLAQGTLLAVAVYLSYSAHSATAGTCFTLAAALILVLHTRKYKGRPKAVQSLIMKLGVIGVLIQITGAQALVLQLIGRNPDLTGRSSEIWPAVIPMCPNVFLGAGFESFWTGSRMQKLWELFPSTYINESHNGYIEVYLNLGFIGLVLLAFVFFYAYRTGLAALRNDPNGASVMLVYGLTALLYNYTEAGFRMLYYTWSFLLLMIMMASYILKHAEETRTAGAPGRGPSTVSSGSPRKTEWWTPQQQREADAVVWGQFACSPTFKGRSS